MHYLVIYVLYHFDIEGGISSTPPVNIDVQICWVYGLRTRETQPFPVHMYFSSTLQSVYVRVYVGHNLAKFQICSKRYALRGDCAMRIDKAYTVVQHCE